MTKKILIIAAILFFAVMFFLSLFAEKIHENMLPEVTASRPEQRLFPYEYIDQNGEPQTGSIRKIAVPKEMLEDGVFVVYTAEKNGTKRNFLRLANIQTGTEFNGFVEVVSGIAASDKIVVKYDKKLSDGYEIKLR